ncbi:MAG: hypothetical protein ACTSXX_14300 [Candidatus Baldrarchaeia archaeon]
MRREQRRVEGMEGLDRELRGVSGEGEDEAVAKVVGSRGVRFIKEKYRIGVVRVVVRR